ncbi:prepilin peptidase [Profundibacter sp.]
MILLVLHIVVYGGFGIGAGGVPWFGPGLAAVLIWISVVDFERFVIPDIASLLLFTGGAVYVGFWPDVAVWQHLLGAVVWPLVFWLVGVVYLRWRGVHGLGFGDVKLMAGIAMWVGYFGAVQVVLAASLAGIAVLMVYMVMQRGRMAEIGKSAVAFAPFLCLSAWVVWLQGVSP